MKLKAHSEQSLTTLVSHTVHGEIDWEKRTVEVDSKFLSSDTLAILVGMFKRGEISCPESIEAERFTL